MQQPYISLVIPTRNDNYPSSAVQGKSLLILQRQLEAARVESEILVVEYNPDPSRPHLSESLRVDEGRYVTVKVISIGAEHHRRFPHWEKRALYQTLAVNVGLRRSRGHFFVYRAADHIYSDGLLRFLSNKSLLDDCIYRCDRYDIDRAGFDAVPAGGSSEEISAVCNAHVVQRHRPVSVEPSYRIPALHTNGCGDFLLMARSLWMRIAGLRQEKYPIFLDDDSLALHAAYALCGCEAILPQDCRVYKLSHGLSSAARVHQVWPSRWKLVEQILSSRSATVRNVFRVIGNYPRRVDRTFEGVQLDSEERHFVLPAFLWAHGFPFIRQNTGTWGLGDEPLPEVTLASADWESGASLRAGPERSVRSAGVLGS
jgi:hypothetical protein